MKTFPDATKVYATHKVWMAGPMMTLPWYELIVASQPLSDRDAPCSRCGGSGLVTIFDYDGNGSDADDQPCPECACDEWRPSRKCWRSSAIGHVATAFDAWIATEDGVRAWQHAPRDPLAAAFAAGAACHAINASDEGHQP